MIIKILTKIYLKIIQEVNINNYHNWKIEPFNIVKDIKSFCLLQHKTTLLRFMIFKMLINQIKYNWKIIWKVNKMKKELSKKIITNKFKEDIKQLK